MVGRVRRPGAGGVWGNGDERRRGADADGERERAEPERAVHERGDGDSGGCDVDGHDGSGPARGSVVPVADRRGGMELAEQIFVQLVGDPGRSSVRDIEIRDQHAGAFDVSLRDGPRTGWRPFRWRCRWGRRCSGSATTRSSGLRSVWDFGLSAAATKTKSKATWTFWIYTELAASGGFGRRRRSYYGLDASSFTTPLKLQGAWALPVAAKYLRTVPASRISAGESKEGDHCGHRLRRIRTGFWSYHYLNPMNWWSSDFQATRSSLRTDTLITRLNSDATSGHRIDGGLRRRSRRWRRRSSIRRLTTSTGSITVRGLPISGTAGTTCRAIRRCRIPTFRLRACGA